MSEQGALDPADRGFLQMKPRRLRGNGVDGYSERKYQYPTVEFHPQRLAADAGAV
jgi:hypothetical protein